MPLACIVQGSDVRLIRLVDEDKCRPLHNGRAGANKGYLGIFDLTFAGASRNLHRPFNDLPQAMNAAGTQAAAKRIERQLAIEFDAPVLDEIEGFPFLAESV